MPTAEPIRPGVRAQTLNQLLTEIDGFTPSTGVVFIAATNRPGLLDPALVRAGRFDRTVTVPRPDAAARTAILKVCSCSCGARRQLAHGCKGRFERAATGCAARHIRALRQPQYALVASLPLHSLHLCGAGRYRRRYVSGMKHEAATPAASRKMPCSSVRLRVGA